MKSGLEGRNNDILPTETPGPHIVSMKSGLEGRNNCRILAIGNPDDPSQ